MLEIQITHRPSTLGELSSKSSSSLYPSVRIISSPTHHYNILCIVQLLHMIVSLVLLSLKLLRNSFLWFFSIYIHIIYTNYISLYFIKVTLNSSIFIFLNLENPELRTFWRSHVNINCHLPEKLRHFQTFHKLENEKSDFTTDQVFI